MTKTLLLALLLPALFLAGGCQGSAPKGGESSAAADLRLPTGTFPALDGGSHTLQAGGRPTVLVFWATWCAPCIREMPEIAKASKALAGRVDWYGVLAGNDDQVNPARARALLAEHGITAPQLRDREGSLVGAMAVRGTPTIIVFGADGRVLYREHHLPDSWEDLLGA